ncbi:heterogeneous nuclear ribonucleoprotein 1 [Selaginella moellendorffii]|uniref:heterogeneous nuclear ribonucleoprotein 1 n=1 Tax=Selaginella moellendorffii TaxID=88036 RepID=UPI000D1C59B2|nr:heterogeneous nuclear ribonucleoprotein 1 [Selaginella moellendorffii]|eukprot:XP_002985671.2 heterogeneous nuclear ribonucleoprotein 1 [Selaginella moellendorffii]
MESDQGKLFIGGISWETTEEQLRDYFQRYGEIAETMIMKDRNTGRARGFGFVSFADPSAADMAVAEKHTINGRLVEAKKAVPRDEQQTIPRSSISSGGQSPGGGQGRTKKIFVGGLASTVTEEEFRGYFEQFGTISDAVVMYDHTTQRPRGFGFITFDSEDSVEAVLMKSFHELKDKMVEVKRAVPRDQSTPSVKPINTLAGMGRAYGQGYPSPQIYGGRPDGRFGAVPARGAYPYPAGGYPGYAGAGYMMNGSYAGGYPGGYATGAGYGGAAGYGNGGGSSPGYGNNLSRSAWPGAAGGYGSSQGYGGGGGGYGAAGMWGSATQAQGGSGGYGGYYSNDNGYGSSGAGYGGRGYGSSPGGYGSTGTGPGSGSYAAGGGSYNGGGYADGYGSAGYADGGNWGGDGGYSGGGGAGANGSYDLNGGNGGENGEGGGYGGGNGSTGYGGAANRQSSQRGGADTRFRPYPATSDRS